VIADIPPAQSWALVLLSRVWSFDRQAVKPELIGRYPAADDREQIGRFLRHAFPLRLDAVSDVMRGLERDDRREAPSRHRAARNGWKADNGGERRCCAPELSLTATCAWNAGTRRSNDMGRDRADRVIAISQAIPFSLVRLCPTSQVGRARPNDERSDLLK
jgi:hypothetical protein